ncbi:Glutelin type-B 2 [Rhynchospora pubera]|uniref:Glutelin type-B 2 n=1 Tax=Rhynchospora pubera TaxID=906938 RepID=A0AAV8D5R1_9POAL|nr:Glutelin type-B 2 [Rhynchospora pubera]
MASSFSLVFSLCLLVLCHGTNAQFTTGGQSPWHTSRGFGDPRGCRFDHLEALNPAQRIQSEAGMTEYYEESSEMLRCAGVSVKRHIVEPRGLLLPAYHNAPSLVYITQGRGLIGMVFPGCPETYQWFQQQAETYTEGTMTESQQRLRDEHQKVRRFQKGDIIALPPGVTHWCYNDGDVAFVAVQVFDTSNSANQLEPARRDFFLAGRHQSVQRMYEMGPQPTSFTTRQQLSNNMLAGFDTQMLAEALGVNQELTRRLQSQNDPRGEIVFVKQGLRMLRPFRSQEMQQQEYESMQSEEQYFGESMPGLRNATNGLDENFCTMKIRSNIDIPNRADYFNQRGSRVAILNSQKLPILNLVQMSAVRVVLQRNSMITPYWQMNCHSLMYVTSGQGRVQVVNHRGRTVFDGMLRQGQILLIPQNFAVIKRAELEMFKWVSFNTNHNAMISQIVGKNSVIRAMPLQVLMHSYRISLEQARRLKFSRQNEMTILSPIREIMRSRDDPMFEVGSSA